MKKYLFIIFSLIAAILSFSCAQNDDSESEKQEEKIAAGWYLYTTNANSTDSQSTYLYVNSSGAIERAGNKSNEYTGTELENLKKSLSYSICKKNADGTKITFEQTKMPDWTNKAPDTGDTGADTGENSSEEETGSSPSDDTGNSGENPSDDTGNSNETPSDDTPSDTPLTLIIGTWYCSDGSLMSYLEFYADGTGKAYLSDPNNCSTFNWSISDSEITFSGYVINKSSFTVNSRNLWFNSLCGLNNLTYTRQ